MFRDNRPVTTAKTSNPRKASTRLRAAAATSLVGLTALVGAGSAEANSLYSWVNKDVTGIDPKVQRQFTIDYTDGEGKPLKDTGMLVDAVLPTDYDKEKAYPLLVVFHGLGGVPYDIWAEELGNIKKAADKLDAIIVMPNITAGAMTVNWVVGQPLPASFPYFPGGPFESKVDDYFTNVVMPEVNKRFKILPGRKNHAIAGVSLGGYSAIREAIRNPGYWGSVASLSGVTSLRDGGMFALLGRDFGLDGFYKAFGPNNGANAIAQDPIVLGGNLRNTRTAIYRGNGQADSRETGFAALTIGAFAELSIIFTNNNFVDNQKKLGINTDYFTGPGVHSWTYFREDIEKFLTWDPFKASNDEPNEWTYDTGEIKGDAWGNKFTFTSTPASVVRFARNGANLSISKSEPVTVQTSGGCTFSGSGPVTISLSTCETTSGPVTSAPAVRSVLQIVTDSKSVPALTPATKTFKVTDTSDSSQATVADAKVTVAGSKTVYRTNDEGLVTIPLKATEPGGLVLTVEKAGYDEGRVTVPVSVPKPIVKVKRSGGRYQVIVSRAGSKPKLTAKLSNRGKRKTIKVKGTKLALPKRFGKGTTVTLSMKSADGLSLGSKKLKLK